MIPSFLKTRKQVVKHYSKELALACKEDRDKPMQNTLEEMISEDTKQFPELELHIDQWDWKRLKNEIFKKAVEEINL